jgi:hypothetical protein
MCNIEPCSTGGFCFALVGLEKPPAQIWQSLTQQLALPNCAVSDWVPQTAHAQSGRSLTSYLARMFCFPPGGLGTQMPK